MSKVLDNELLLQEDEVYGSDRNLGEMESRNEVAGLIETIKRHEQEIVDLKRERNALQAEVDAKYLFLKAQSNLVEELKQQVLKALHTSSSKEVYKTETEGGMEQ